MTHSVYVDRIRPKESRTRTKFPESLTSVGMLGRWRKASAKQMWEKLPVGLQNSCKEVPGWLRKFMHLKQKGRDANWFAEIELQAFYTYSYL